MSHNVGFKARAHLLKLLGDQLIGNDRLAVFELVKNAYDANATEVDVRLELDIKTPVIRIKDNGYGMDFNTLVNKWMELGTNSKRGVNRQRTPEPFSRLPLGEKGVGRLAVHKLGTSLRLVTRAQGHPEYYVDINWPDLIDSSEYIEDATISIFENKTAKEFTGNTGTLIEVTGLHKTDWIRREVRNLAKLINSLVSPFDTVSDFSVSLRVPGREAWLADLPDVTDILDRSIWQFDFEIDDAGNFSWKYRFTPPTKFKSIQRNESGEDKDSLQLLPSPFVLGEDYTSSTNDNLILTSEMLEGIGPIRGRCYFYYLRKEVLGADGNYQYVKTYLDDQTGIRVYRDGIRVFNYGEPGDDWLSLNPRRINKPTEVLGTNSIIAGIGISLDKSLDPAGKSGLQEKTNREGFDENETYQRFRWIVSSAFEKFFILHRSDREGIDRYLGDVREVNKPSPETTFESSIEDVSRTIEKHGLKKELGKKIDYISAEYQRMRDVAINTGKGLNLAVIFHEVEREIVALNKAIKKGEPSDALADRSEHLVSLLEGFQPLLRRNEQKTFEISKLIRNTSSPMQRRMTYHGIVLSAPVLTGEDADFTITAPYGLVMASLQNLLENAMHWSRVKAEKDKKKIPPAIGIFTLPEWFEEGPAIAVADNGTGFSLSQEDAVKPFVTDRPGGAGLGLYFVNLVMENIGGRLLIMDPEELELPKAYSGAVVVMLFKVRKK